MGKIKCEICGVEIDPIPSEKMSDPDNHGFIHNFKYHFFCSEECKRQYRKEHKV